MGYLEFVSRMLYFKGAQFRAAEYEKDFLEMRLLTTIYSTAENLRFLIFALDHIEITEAFAKDDLLWSKDTSLLDIFKLMLGGHDEILRTILLYATLRYFFLGAPPANFPDFIRVIRNLLENTADKSIREWPRLLLSIDNLIGKEHVFDILIQPNALDLLEGFYLPQRREEILKARIIRVQPAAQQIFEQAENNAYLRGNIMPLIAQNEKEPELFDVPAFQSLYRSYEIISEEDFELVWGDLLNSQLYTQNKWQRLICDDDYPKNQAVINLASDHAKSYQQYPILEDFLRHRERLFLVKKLGKTPDLSETRNVKEQLYIYYILHRRIMKCDINRFFANGFNFGWLAKDNGYVSLFKKGIADDEWFDEENPIFQTYRTQFRYNLGLKTENALPAEVVGLGRKNNPFELLAQWAENNE